MKMNQVLIAGGAGFLGSTIVNTLLQSNYKINVLDSLKFGAKSLSKFKDHENFTFYFGDITNKDDVERAIQNCQYVIALAAIVGDPACRVNPDLTHKINFQGSENLINASIKHKVKRFLFASSCSVYGQNPDLDLKEEAKLNPISLYAESQVATENALIKVKDELNFTILRLSTLYGLSPRRRFDLVINNFAGKLANGEQIEIIGGQQWRPFLHIKDAAKAFQNVIEADEEMVNGQIFNIGANENNFQMSEIGEIIRANIPNAKLKTLAERSDARSYHVNFDKAKTTLGFKPKNNIHTAIKEMVEDIQKNQIDTQNYLHHNGKAWSYFQEEKYIPFAVPEISQIEKQEILKTIDSGWLSAGPKVAKFENALFDYFGKDDLHCISVSSCTAALHLQLLANNIGPGDEVITSVNTFAATVITILQCGAKPVLVDINPEDLNLDIDQVKEKITPKTKAIVPVYYAGNPCDHYKLKKICQKNGILILADAAHAFGGCFDGQKIGTYEDSAAFSFYATKNLTTGEGGLITTSNQKLAERLKKMRSFGRQTFNDKPNYLYEITEEGYKYNFTDIQASFGIHQLKKIDAFNQYRSEIVAFYNENFKDCPYLTLPRTNKLAKSTNHLYPLQVHFNKLSLSKLEFIKAIAQKKIGLSVHYVPIHHHSYFQRKLGIKANDFKQCNFFYDQEISLPVYTKLKIEDLKRITNAVIETIAIHT